MKSIGGGGNLDGEIGNEALYALVEIEQYLLLRSEEADIRAVRIAQKIILLLGDDLPGGLGLGPCHQTRQQSVTYFIVARRIPGPVAQFSVHQFALRDSSGGQTRESGERQAGCSGHGETPGQL